ncbi:histidinol-phosphate aminotransferase family protein [Flavobacteriaceae bacterium TP-CH-4]|uniref:Histidinol-phosphate aminotransferase family protein n=1 Tax=Pelagihabitans pacificus TaxID=2696054 RepID=A0A967EAX0_9FLAO|nr:histidinol-phosphate transaminase [Pelagihabitans pacificus]NHF59836.1 histidinol-phosphate aminotransferase family protein [Pelagihabitans pacificus]
MRTIDRRNWLKTMGLSGGFALLGGLDALALNTTTTTRIANRVAKLNSNENPFGPSDRVRAVITETFDDACRYPFQALSGLVPIIADKEGVTKDHVVVTGGSTEGLKAAGITYGLHGKEIIAADPTFQAMLRYAETFGAHVHRVPVDDNFGHDLEAMERRVTGNTGLIFVCNPNNPTGTLLDKDKLKDFCSAVDHRAVVFSDEAYYDYITEPDYPSMVELVKQGRNVIVSKTFSKVFGLAGLRIGYLIARPDIADRLKASVMANTNILAIEAAKEALRDDDFYKFSLAKNVEAKEHVYRTLNNLRLQYIPSHTNFVFFKTGRPIGKLITDMANEQVIIGRPFPPFFEWARISTGTLQEMERFGTALKKVLG